MDTGYSLWDQEGHFSGECWHGAIRVLMESAPCFRKLSISQGLFTARELSDRKFSFMLKWHRLFYNILLCVPALSPEAPEETSTCTHRLDMFERPLILVQPKNSRGFSTISHNSMFFQTSPNWSLFSDSPWFTVLLLWPTDLTQSPRCRLTSRLGLPAAFRDDALLTMFPRVHPIFNNNNINMYHFLDS